jgi:hypothetical protein
MLRQFCASETWPPVYLDEVAAVFVRRSAETEDLIDRLGIQCVTVLAARRRSARGYHRGVQ